MSPFVSGLQLISLLVQGAALPLGVLHMFLAQKPVPGPAFLLYIGIGLCGFFCCLVVLGLGQAAYPRKPEAAVGALVSQLLPVASAWWRTGHVELSWAYAVAQPSLTAVLAVATPTFMYLFFTQASREDKNWATFLVGGVILAATGEFLYAMNRPLFLEFVREGDSAKRSFLLLTSANSLIVSSTLIVRYSIVGETIAKKTGSRSFFQGRDEPPEAMRWLMLAMFLAIGDWIAMVVFVVKNG